MIGQPDIGVTGQHRRRHHCKQGDVAPGQQGHEARPADQRQISPVEALAAQPAEAQRADQQPDERPGLPLVEVRRGPFLDEILQHTDVDRRQGQLKQIQPEGVDHQRRRRDQADHGQPADPAPADHRIRPGAEQVARHFPGDEPGEQDKRRGEAGVHIAPDEHHHRDQPQPVNMPPFVEPQQVVHDRAEKEREHLRPGRPEDRRRRRAEHDRQRPDIDASAAGRIDEGHAPGSQQPGQQGQPGAAALVSPEQAVDEVQHILGSPAMVDPGRTRPRVGEQVGPHHRPVLNLVFPAAQMPPDVGVHRRPDGHRQQEQEQDRRRQAPYRQLSPHTPTVPVRESANAV